MACLAFSPSWLVILLLIARLPPLFLMMISLLLLVLHLPSLIFLNLLLSLSLVLVELFFSNHALCSTDLVSRCIVFSTGCHHDW